MEGPAEVVLVPTGTGIWFLQHHLQPGNRSGEKQMVGINWSWGLLGGGVVGGLESAGISQSVCSPDFPLSPRGLLTWFGRMALIDSCALSPQESALASIKCTQHGLLNKRWVTKSLINIPGGSSLLPPHDLSKRSTYLASILWCFDRHFWPTLVSPHLFSFWNRQLQSFEAGWLSSDSKST